ncbi:MAG: M81 family peptidase [Geminicoccaceae bacterium]|nr:MAG: M81 family peptidase [Geminicoccaceae bacterium]
MTRKLFIATLGTETNSFAALPTGDRLFEETCLFRRGSYGDHPPVFAAPLVVWRRRAGERGWQVIEGLCAFAMPAGPTVGRIYRQYRDEILADLRANLPVDAVLLSLHGAMVADGHDQAEAELVEAVRGVVGPDVPIGVELDLHANVGQRMLEHATVVVLFKEYPHTDIPDRAEEVFTLVADALEHRTRPVMAAVDCRTIGVFHTTREPMRGFVDRLRALEGRDGILSVSAIHGFPWADVADMGSKILVIADGDAAKARAVAARLAREFYALRAATQPSYLTLDEAMARAAAHGSAPPLVLADVADNAGGGAASDSTYVLEALLHQGIGDVALGMVWDPMAVRIACELGVGGRTALRLGGKLGPFSGGPLDLEITVTGLRPNALIGFAGAKKGSQRAGDMAALRIETAAGPVDVVCNTLRAQCASTDCFTHVGIDPATKRVVVVKSMQHFHAAFAPLAAEVLYVAAAGALMPDFGALPYRKADRRQWPLVDDPFA